MRNYLIASGLICLAALSATAADKEEPKATEWTGKLETGIVAIGGETTGVVLTTKSGRFELQLNKEQREKAEKLNGKQVTVTGKLTIKKGVEVRERRIIEVTTIKATANE